MQKYELKTKPTDDNVEAFLGSVTDPQKQADAWAVAAMMAEVTGAPAKMWGSSIVGFSLYTYKYASGQEGEWPVLGFSPRKTALTLYISDGFDDRGDILNRLGNYKTSKACLYIKHLSDVDRTALRELLQASYDYFKKHNFRLEFTK